MAKIKPGDLAEVINSVDGAAVGQVVTVLSFEGEHSQLGRIWRCQSKQTLVTEYGAVGNVADFAEDWLLKIDDPDTVIEDFEDLTAEH